MDLGTVRVELLGNIPYYYAMILYAGTSVLLGGLVGVDRERKFKSAGIKTHILISLGSTLFTAISMANMSLNTNADPNRVAAQIISGIGFLGAGAIIQSKKGIFGLTTAATIWLVAGLGMSVGSGYPFTATIFTIFALFVLNFINPVYKIILKKRFFHLEIIGYGKPSSTIHDIIDSRKYDVKDFNETRSDNDTFVLHYYIKMYPKDMSKISGELNQVSSIRKINYHAIEELRDNLDYEDD